MSAGSPNVRDAKLPTCGARRHSSTLIERGILRWYAKLDWISAALFTLGVALLVLALLLVSCGNESNHFSLTATTDVLAFRVSAGDPLEWPLGGGLRDCYGSAPAPLARGARLLLYAPLRVAVRVRHKGDGTDHEMVEFAFSSPATSQEHVPSPRPLHLLSGMSGPGQPIDDTIVCMEMASMRSDLTFPLRGAVEVGDDPSPKRSAMLREGEISLYLSPSHWRAWLLAQAESPYRVEMDKLPLKFGDKIILPSTGGCAHDPDNCPETLGIMRLAVVEDGESPSLGVRLASNSEEVRIVSPGRGKYSVSANFFRRVANDTLASILITVGISFCGIGLAVVELLRQARQHVPASPPGETCPAVRSPDVPAAGAILPDAHASAEAPASVAVPSTEVARPVGPVSGQGTPNGSRVDS